MAPSSYASSQSRHSPGPEASSSGWDDMSFDMNDPNISESSTPPQAILGRNGPILCRSAEKYRPSYSRSSRDPSVEIDLSQMADAFPDFSQNYNNSILATRDGARNPSQGSTSKSRGSRMMSRTSEMYEEEDTFNQIPVYMDGKQVRYPSSKTMKQSSLRKRDASLNSGTHLAKPYQTSAMQSRENMQSNSTLKHGSQAVKSIDSPNAKGIPPPSHGKATRVGSAGLKTGDEKRPTLAQFHSRVGNNTQNPLVDEERPLTLNLTAKNTRFSSITVPKTRKPGHPAKSGFKDLEVLPEIMVDDKPKPQISSSRASLPARDTTNQHSTITITKIPAVDELVSGVFEDGTPVFRPKTKSRVTRFISSSTDGQRANDADELNDITHNEKELLLSLELLQDKVAGLERGQAESENMIRDLQLHNHTLEREKAQLKQRHRSDSALGSEDDGSDDGGRINAAHRKIIDEKNRLESKFWSIRTQLEKLQRDDATKDTTLKNVSRERDQAISQLGVAYYTMEGLKATNEDLIQENNSLKALVASLTKSTAESNSKGADAFTTIDTSNFLAEDSSVVIHRKKDQTDDCPLVNNAINTRQVDRVRDQQHTLPSNIVNVTEPPKNNDPRRRNAGSEATLENFGGEGDVAPSPTKNDNSFLGHRSTKSENDIGSAHKINALKPGKTPTANSDREAVNLQANGSECSSNDLTYLSLNGDKSIDEVRRSIEQERLARKERQRSRNTDPPIQPSKNNYRRIPEPSVILDQKKDTNQNAQNAFPRDEMTSGFIVPDITIRQLIDENQSLPDVLENGAKLPHEYGINPLELPDHKLTHDDTKTKRKIKVSKPVPVSERKLDITPYEEEPTMRPSRPPGIALAVVLKGLEDEIAQSKLKLSKYQSRFNQTTSATSRRQRKQIQSKIQSLVQDIDAKSDHIYNLYDVLEGQKENGQEMSQDELELTLSSIGIDMSSVIDDFEEHEIAWEGIDSTTGQRSNSV